MKVIYFVIALLVMGLSSCTTDIEETDYQYKLSALASFDNSFNSNFDQMVSTRSVINETDGFVSDSLMALFGRNLCVQLKVPTDELLNSFGLSDQLLLETYKEYEDSLQGASSFEEYKFFTALTLYDVYLTDKTRTRADVLDVLSCIGLGSTAKSLADLSTRQIAKFAAKKLIGRVIPGIGWGWAAATGAYCLAGL